MTAVMEDLVSSCVMIEIDRDVAAFWRATLESGAVLCDLVTQFEPTIDKLRAIEESHPATVLDHGFRTLVLNRTRRGGILARGASFSRKGENGRGVLSRWYPETLTTRLSTIQKYADRIAFVEGDGMQLLPVLLRGWGRDAAVFLDPPYTAHTGKQSGLRLYEHSNVDHERLFALLAEHRTNFLMTYDASPEIIDLVDRYGFEVVSLSMKNTHHNQIPELVITSERLFA